jgi:glycogen(starch) synthase
MNIALFVSSFYPSIGGVEELCRQLAHEYPARGMGVIVIVNRWPRSMAHFEEYEGIPVYRLPLRMPDGNWRVKLNYHLTTAIVRRKINAIIARRKIDLLHVQCVSCNALYAMAAKKASGLPLVVTLQGELTMDASQLYQRSAVARAMMRQALQAADSVTACSQQTLEEARDFFGREFPGSSSVIYNGVRLSDFADQAPHQHSKPYILAIGRHVPQKGFDQLIRALALLRQQGRLSHDLLLAGDGSQHEELKRLAGELGLESSVVFLGRVDRPRTVALFRGCSFFVLPSRHEPLGIVNLEAMAAGKAIVATRVGGVPELIHDNENGLLVENNNVPALAGAVGQLMDDADLRDRLAAQSGRHAARFDWKVIADQYMEVYRSVGAGQVTGAQDQPVPSPLRSSL